MSELILKPNKSNIFSNILRFAVGGFGVIYIVSTISETFPNGNFEVLTVLNLFVGLGFIVLALANPTLGANIKILLNDDFLRTTEDLVLVRSAYWKKLEGIALTRFSIQVTYPSGTKEKFRLPFLTNEEFQNLRERLVEKSKHHQFEFREKPWWSFFGF
jgi:hypothetical protein